MHIGIQATTGEIAEALLGYSVPAHSSSLLPEAPRVRKRNRSEQVVQFPG
jgi:hypothetical protein